MIENESIWRVFVMRSDATTEEDLRNCTTSLSSIGVYLPV